MFMAKLARDLTRLPGPPNGGGLVRDPNRLVKYSNLAR